MALDFSCHIRHYAIWLGNVSPQARILFLYEMKKKAYSKKWLITSYPTMDKSTDRLREKKQRTYLLVSVADKMY